MGRFAFLGFAFAAFLFSARVYASPVTYLSTNRSISSTVNITLDAQSKHGEDAHQSAQGGAFSETAAAHASLTSGNLSFDGFATATQDSLLSASLIQAAGNLEIHGVSNALGSAVVALNGGAQSNLSANFQLDAPVDALFSVAFNTNVQKTSGTTLTLFNNDLNQPVSLIPGTDHLVAGNYTFSFTAGLSPTSSANLDSQHLDYDVSLNFSPNATAVPLPAALVPGLGVLAIVLVMLSINSQRSRFRARSH